MKISKKQLKRIIKEEKRKIIRESCGDIDLEGPVSLEKDLGPSELGAESPCPYGTADQLRASGMTDSEVLTWVNTLLSEFLSGDDFSFTGDVGELGGDEAFGVGYEAGSRGL